MKRSSMILKCALDIVGVLVGVLVIPVVCLIALAIKLEDRGPIFFRQLRVGRHGERFAMLKFRTMVPNAEDLKDSLRDRNEAQEGLFKIADDPRVTRIGKLLRKSALDELPQLINIIRGEMSLVGPRPLVPDEDRMIEGCLRTNVLPGMTGPWQILGPSRVSLKEMAAIDDWYVANWSSWMDLKILAATVLHVVRRRGDMNASSTSQSRKVVTMFRSTTTKARQFVIATLTVAFLAAGTGGVIAASGGLPPSGNAALAQYSMTSTSMTSTSTSPVVPPPVVIPPPVVHPKPPVKPVTCKKHFVKRHHKCVRIKTKKRKIIKRHHAAFTG